MTKIRSRAVKPKIQKGDFAKKKVKVGRKVKRANVTEIKVKSRRIVVPLQNHGTAEDGESTREAINRVIKQLHHYSESTRLNALNRVKDMLNVKITEESFVTLLLPEVIELLFNEEKETRTAVTDVVALMLGKFSSDAFLPVISVAVTYLCSGLSNIHKGIRKDALVILRTFAQKCPILLVPYMEKLLRHTLLLLTDSFQSASAPLLQQRDALVTTALQVQGKVATDGIGSGASGANKKFTPTMFILILEVLAALLEHSGSRGASKSANVSSGMEVQFDTVFASNAALLLTRFDGSHLTGTGTAQELAPLPADLLVDIVEHVTTVWQNLVMNSSAVAMDVLASLQACTKILVSISRSTSRNSTLTAGTEQASVSRRLGAAVLTMFQHFPHSCIESNLAVPGSEKERHGTARVAQLDIALCEVAFLHIAAIEDEFQLTSAPIIRLREVATAYLLQILRKHTEDVQSDLLAALSSDGTKREGPSELEKLAAVKIFKSFELLLSRNTITALHELLQLLGVLFSTLQQVKPSMRRSLNFLAAPASECLCAVIERTHSELGEDYTEELYLLVVDALASAMSLALAATWDQTALVAKLVHATLLTFQGRAASCYSEAMSASIANLGDVFMQFWTPPASAPPVQAPSKGKLAFHNTFTTASESTRRKLLDIYLYVPFEDLYSASEQILTFLCTTNGVNLAEQEHFLRLLFDRRQELGAGDVVELLFTSLRHRISTIGHANESTVPMEGARWFAHGVGAVLFWMASSESPAKIVLFLSKHIDELLASAVQEAAVSSVGDGDGDDADDGAALKERTWYQAAVLALCSGLLLPWIVTVRRSCAAKPVEEEEQPAVRRLLSWLSAVTAFILTQPVDSATGIEVHRDTIAAIMSMRVDPLLESNSDASAVPAVFAVYQAVLDALSTQMHSRDISAAQRESLLRNLHATMQSPRFDEQMFVECRQQLGRCLEAIVSGVAEGERALLRNLAADILALF